MWVYPWAQFWFKQLIVDWYQDHFWQEHFRVSRETFEHICGLFGPQLVCQNAIHCEAIAVEKQVAVALWRLCTRNLWRTVGLTFGIGCCRAMNIKGKTIQEFQNINRFPQVVGALDGLHIPINPLHPNINMLILYTLLPTFPKVLTMRIYLKIRSSFIWWSFSIFL